MLRFLWLSVAVVVLDQVSKQAVETFMAARPPLELMSFLDLVLAYNRGAAFSFLNTAGGWQKYLFLGVAVVAVVICLRMLKNLKPGETQMALALALIIGGAVGNAIDRALFGHVIDFILLHYRGWAWPAFNVADSAITVGAVLLVLDAIGIRLIGERGRSRHLPT